jgi:hypothetical protein
VVGKESRKFETGMVDGMVEVKLGVVESPVLRRL